MTGHLRQQVIEFNHIRDFSELSANKLQSTLDKFNRYSQSGGNMRNSTKRERLMDGKRVGWTSITTATEYVMKQMWMDEIGYKEQYREREELAKERNLVVIPEWLFET